MGQLNQCIDLDCCHHYRLPADGAVQDAFLNGTPDELRELVLRLNNERDRLSKDNTLLTRKLAVFEDDTENSASDTGSRRHEVATLDKERGPAKEGDWMESLQVRPCTSFREIIY